MNRLLSFPGRILGGWRRFWFAPADPTTLGAVRMATGAVLFYVYAACTPTVLSYIGPNALIDPTALEVIREQGGNPGRWYGWSVYFLVSEPWAINAIYWGF